MTTIVMTIVLIKLQRFEEDYLLGVLYISTHAGICVVLELLRTTVAF